ncbi:MAG: glycosyltransferase family 2 protein, partial [Gammaproteobacteria bacterium]|nr:glycosyltransferase family 2 protein [Gammaproteobacteria bacterium]
MPVRNAQSTLDECLQSIRAQTFADFELLIVNDHST